MKQQNKPLKKTPARPQPARRAAPSPRPPQTAARPNTARPAASVPTPRPSAQRSSARPRVPQQRAYTVKPDPNAIDRTLKAQSPAQRKAQRSGKHITGSAKNLEVNRHQRSTKVKFHVKKKRSSMRVILFRMLAFLVAFVLLFAAFAALFTLSLTRIHGIAGSDYAVQIGEDKATTTVKYTSSASIVGANGTYNISIDAMRGLCEFTVTGDANELRYIPRGSTGQSAAFVIGTNTAYVNGVAVRMESPCFTYGGNLYVPISFFKNYAINLNVIHNPSEYAITVKRTETAESAADTKKDADEAVFEPISFTLSPDAPVTGITEASVDAS